MLRSRLYQDIHSVVPYGCGGAVFEPSRSGDSLYLKHAWLAGVRVCLTCEYGSISYDGGDR